MSSVLVKEHCRDPGDESLQSQRAVGLPRGVAQGHVGASGLVCARDDLSHPAQIFDTRSMGYLVDRGAMVLGIGEWGLPYQAGTDCTSFNPVDHAADWPLPMLVVEWYGEVIGWMNRWTAAQ